MVNPLCLTDGPGQLLWMKPGVKYWWGWKQDVVKLIRDEESIITVISQSNCQIMRNIFIHQPIFQFAFFKSICLSLVLRLWSNFQQNPAVCLCCRVLGHLMASLWNRYKQYASINPNQRLHKPIVYIYESVWLCVIGQTSNLTAHTLKWNPSTKFDYWYSGIMETNWFTFLCFHIRCWAPVSLYI